MEYAYSFGRPADHHSSYIHLTIRDKNQLEQLRSKLHDSGHRTAEFHEPYQDWGLTAIAICVTEEDRRLLKGLQLWRLPTQD